MPKAYPPLPMWAFIIKVRSLFVIDGKCWYLFPRTIGFQFHHRITNLRGVQMNIADFITSFISLLGVGTWVRQQKIHQFIAANLVLFDTTCGYLLSHWKYLQRYPRWCQNFIWCVIYRDDSWIWSTCVGRTKYQQNLQNCKNFFLTSFGVVRRSLSFERTIFPFRSHNLKDGWWRFCVQVVRKSKS